MTVGPEVRFHELANVPRQAEPVTLGVPFPKGMLVNVRTIRLLDDAGRDLPQQVRVAATWPDGSVRWAILDTQISACADQMATARIEVAPQPATVEAQDRLWVRDTGDSIIITTGPARFEISKARLTIVERAWLDLDGDGHLADGEMLLCAGEDSGPSVTDLQGRRFCGGISRPEVVEIEETGPLKGVIRSEGWLASADGSHFTRALVRLTAYAGKPYLTIAYTLIAADHPDEPKVADMKYEVPPIKLERYTEGLSFLRYRVSHRAWDYIKDWRISFTLPDQIDSATFGGVGVFPSPANLVQYSDDSYALHRGLGYAPEDEIGRGERAQGWMTVPVGGAALTLAVEDFWQNFPKELCAEAQTVSLGLWPQAVPPLDFPKGFAKTHRLLLLLHRPDAADLPATLAAFNQPLVPAVQPEWAAVSSAFVGNPLITASEGQAACPVGESRLEAQTQSFRDLRAKRRMYGLRDFGGNGYSNLQHDLIQDLLVQFVRTGNPAHLPFVAPMVRHYCDVDVRHFHTDKRLEGGGILPDKEDYQLYTSPHTALCVSMSHSYVEGLLNYAFLTGDRRACEVGLKMGEAMTAAMEPEGAIYVEARPDAQQWIADNGQALVGLCALYEATGRQGYLEAARRCAAYLLRTQNQDGSWFARSPGALDQAAGFERTVGAGENIFSDKGGVSQSVVLRGLMRFHQVTGDDDVAQAFLQGVAFMVNRSRTEDGKGFADSTWRGNPLQFEKTGLDWYKNTPRFSPACTSQMLECLAYAFALTNEPEYLRQACNAYARLLAEAPAPVAVAQPWQEAPAVIDLGSAKHFPAFFLAPKAVGWPEPELSE